MALPAWKVAEDVAEGYVTLNPVVLKKYTLSEVNALAVELDKVSRETRSQVTPSDDSDAAQKKNRRLLRLSQATLVLQTHKSRMGRSSSG
ncbi:hypothetical protein FBQ97_06035 [Acidobacteria bacterium ACD]|nr:MAG: hypothetical protein EDX89_23025 [Acidobacteriota bacterium]MDL1949362.1 hypothetical protein [Acidobacteria bacterium ACD]